MPAAVRNLEIHWMTEFVSQSKSFRTTKNISKVQTRSLLMLIFIMRMRSVK